MEKIIHGASECENACLGVCCQSFRHASDWPCCPGGSVNPSAVPRTASPQAAIQSASPLHRGSSLPGAALPKYPCQSLHPGVARRNSQAVLARLCEARGRVHGQCFASPPHLLSLLLCCLPPYLPANSLPGSQGRGVLHLPHEAALRADEEESNPLLALTTASPDPSD